MESAAAYRPRPLSAPLRKVTAMAGVAVLAAAGGVLVTAMPANAAPPVTTVSWSYVSTAPQTFTIPTGVTSIDFSVTGGRGGKGGGTNGGAGGTAHVVTGSLDVSAGQVLDIYVAAPGGVGLNADDSENSTPTVGLPGAGGWGYTSGGDGGFGSLLSRPGGGGGGSSAILVQGQASPAAVGAGGGGGGGRGVFGFCFGGNGGAGDVNGSAGLAADDCLIPGLGGLTDSGLNGNGTDGGDVILFGGGGGGGGAGASGQGGGGGFAGAHPGVPVNLGAGGGGGAGGGSIVTDPDGDISAAAPGDAATVQISYSRLFETSLSASATGTPVYGQQAEVSVTVSNVTDPTIPVTDGVVTLTRTGVSPVTSNVVNGVANFELSGLPAGTVDFDLAYAPASTSTFEASTGTGSVEVLRAPTNAQVAVQAGPHYGTTEIYAVVVPLDSTLGQPTGNVEFFEGGTSLGVVPLVDGIAVLPGAAELTPGEYEFTAVYLGDASFAPSTSDETPIVIAGALTTVTLSIGTDPRFGETEISAAVAAVDPSLGTPTGDVEFLNHSTSLGTFAIEDGIAVLKGADALAPGTYEITAIYSGDALFESSLSPATPLSIAKAAATIALTVSPSPNAQNVAVTPTATVTGIDESRNPTGSLGLRVNGHVVQYISAAQTGTGSVTVTFDALTLAAGENSLDVVYVGDDFFESGRSATVVQRTTAVPPTPQVVTIANTGLDVTAGIGAGLVLLAGGMLLLVSRRRAHS